MTSGEIERIIMRMATENAWGVVRIHGELIRMGLGRRVSISTVRLILRRNGVPPDRRGMTRWRDFRARHPESIWATDFFTAPVHSLRGRRDAYVMAWIHVPTRRIWCSAATWNPDKQWVVQQTRNWQMWAEDQGLVGTGVISDRDTKYGAAFRALVEGLGHELWRIPPRQPHCNGHIERLIGSIKRELVDPILFHEIDEVDGAVSAFERWYHTERPHQGLGNRVSTEAMKEAPELATEAVDEDRLRCVDHHRGLLVSYVWEDSVEMAA